MEDHTVALHHTLVVNLHRSAWVPFERAKHRAGGSVGSDESEPRGTVPPSQRNPHASQPSESQGSESYIRPPALCVDRPTFARHNTFHPRFGWLKKGFDAAVEDPSVFSREDAPVILGVGKNMVRAIKHWCLAFGLIVDDESGGRGFEAAATPFGTLLLGPNGIDPYLEDLGSLWLLHWRLVGNAHLATGWWYGFFQFAPTEFKAEELASAIDDFVAREAPKSRYAYSSYKKDAACLIRMYAELPTGFSGEESIHCPFAELALIRPVGKKHYGFQIGPKPGLTDYLVAFAAAEFACGRGETTRSVPLGALVRDPGSPGLAFRLGEAALYGALERVADRGLIKISDSGGLIQVVFEEHPAVVADEVLQQHYAAAGIGVI